MIAGNLNRDVSDVRLFEIGTVFSGTHRQSGRAACAGVRRGWNLPQQGALHTRASIDFHDMKGAVEQLISRVVQLRTDSHFDRFPPESRA